MAAVPKPQPKDWLAAAADELRQGDKATLALLQESYRNINKILQGLPDAPDAAFGDLIYRAQLERTRRALLAEQAKLFDKLGDKTSARRLRSASRAAKLSAASDAALLDLVGEGAEGERLYAGANITAQRTVETILARAKLSAVPLAERIYNTKSWMNKRLDTLIATTMAKGLNARRFAKVARDWFSPSVPGGTLYAAMRLARTEINNAFHATSITYAQDKPWVSQMEWHLSKSHPTVDICNKVAAESPYDVHLVPRKPHPQCMCYVTEVAPDEDEWIDRFVAGEFDDYLDGKLAEADAALGIKPEASAPQRDVKVTRAATPVARPKTSGSDLTDTVAAAMRDGHAKNIFNEPSSYTDPVDRVIEAVGQMQGFAGLSSTGNLDEVLKSGGIELWRGVVPFAGRKDAAAKSAEEIVEEFRAGAYAPGKGIYGDGYYFSVVQRVAEYFAKPTKKASGGQSFRAALKPGSRIIDYDDLRKQYHNWRQELAANGPDMEQYFKDFQTPEGKIPPTLLDKFSDPGRWAVLMGYDAIRVHGHQDGAPFVKGEPGGKNEMGHKFSAHDQYVILNRTALVLEV